MRNSISAQSCDSVPPAPGWMARMTSRSSCSPESFMVISMAVISLSIWAMTFSRSSSTASPSRCSSRSTSSSSAFVVSDSPVAMRRSTRARFRPSSCAASGLSQKPGADISSSISFSARRAASGSKIAPDRGEAVFEVGDLLEGFFFHGASLSTRNVESRMAHFEGSCQQVRTSHCPRYSGAVRTRLAPIIGMTLLILASRQILASENDERVAWLKAHAIAVATIDPASTDLADLEPLRGILSGVRIVMLGEATRGDGSAFLAKTRLIRFLYEKLGFDVLLFDDGFYDCAHAWDEIRAGADSHQALGHTLNPAYPEAAQFQPLINLIATHAAGDRPLAVAGLDDQMSGGTNGKSLVADLRANLMHFDIEPGQVSGFAEFETTLENVLLERYFTGETAVPSGQQQLRVLATLEELRRRLTAWRDPQPSASSPDSAFWLQVLDNVECYTKSSWRSGKYVRGAPFSPELSNIRDRQMAANLVWLARHRFRGRK